MERRSVSEGTTIDFLRSHTNARMREVLLADGYIDALGNIVCPLHRYKYNMENGRNVSGEGYYLKHWLVECREDGVYVGL